MAGFNFGTPSTTSSSGGMFGSGTAGSTSGFAFGTSTPAASGQPSGFSFGAGSSTPVATNPATGFGLGTPGAAPASTATGAGFSFTKPAGTGTPGFGGFGTPAGTTPSTATGTSGFGGFGTTPGATTTSATPGFSGFGAPAGTPASTATGFPGFGAPAGTPSTTATATPGFTGFGATQGTAAPAPGAPVSTPGFSFGAAKSTAPTGFTLPTQQTPASGSFALGTTPASTPGGSSLSGLLGQPTSTPASGLLASLASSVASTAAPGLGGTPQTTTSLFGMKTTASTSTTPGLGLTMTGTGLKLGATTSQTAPTGVAPSSLAPALGFGGTSTTSAPAVGFGLTGTSLAASSAPGFGSLSTATSKPATTTAVPSQQLNYKQLEEQINKWTTDLEEQERQFLSQATQVNAWDRLLVDNGEKITQLNNDKERVKIDQNKLEQELDFIKSQQRELEDLLIPMEKSLDQLPNSSFQQHADLERDNTYQLADIIDAQLKRMVQDLKEIIDHLNSSNNTQDTNDPILQITMILNAHMDSLQWIDTNTALLNRRVEDISKQMESQRKDQERNFRLVYD